MRKTGARRRRDSPPYPENMRLRVDDGRGGVVGWGHENGLERVGGGVGGEGVEAGNGGVVHGRVDRRGADVGTGELGVVSGRGRGVRERGEDRAAGGAGGGARTAWRGQSSNGPGDGAGSAGADRGGRSGGRHRHRGAGRGDRGSRSDSSTSACRGGDGGRWRGSSCRRRGRGRGCGRRRFGRRSGRCWKRCAEWGRARGMEGNFSWASGWWKHGESVCVFLDIASWSNGRARGGRAGATRDRFH